MNKEYYELSDQILKRAFENQGQIFDDDILKGYKQDGTTYYQKRKQFDNLLEIMINYEFIYFRGSQISREICLTPLGFRVSKTGTEHFFKEIEKKTRIAERKEWLELQNLEWLVKMKWWPLAISVVSLIAAVVIGIWF